MYRGFKVYIISRWPSTAPRPTLRPVTKLAYGLGLRAEGLGFRVCLGGI